MEQNPVGLTMEETSRLLHIGVEHLRRPNIPLFLGREQANHDQRGHSGMGNSPREDAGRDENGKFARNGNCTKKQEAGMNKPLIFTAALMSAALVAGAAVDADNQVE